MADDANNSQRKVRQPELRDINANCRDEFTDDQIEDLLNRDYPTPTPVMMQLSLDAYARGEFRTTEEILREI